VPARVLIILDEAYLYAQGNPRYPDSMHYGYEQCLTLNVSKIYGLAGVRIGYGFAHEVLIAICLRSSCRSSPVRWRKAAGVARVGGQ